MPAALAASMPTGASSKTTARDGDTPAFSAATRKISGSGLPRAMSSSEAIAANRPDRPHDSTVRSRLGRTPLDRAPRPALQVEMGPPAARADRQADPRRRQAVEQLAHAVHQGNVPPR